MARTTRTLTATDVHAHIRDHVFGTASVTAADPHAARHSVGIELEWLTGYRSEHQRLSLDQAHAVVADLSPLPKASLITVEPGGQLELSSAPFASVAEAVAATATDLYVLDQACAHRRIDLFALGADPVRAPERIVTAPRYAVMEAYFDQLGRAGRTMMSNTAAIQLNVGLGDERHTATRWRLANALGPVLVACFANSPFADGRPSGWRSTRLRTWWALDPGRSAPVPLDGDPIRRWTEYALAADVMLIRSGDHHRPTGAPLPFGRWLTDGHEQGWPDLDDLAYHLTTLFPPVRPRGWLELRMFDALPTPFWQVAVAVTCALLDDTDQAAAIADLVAGTEHLWIDAAQLGLGHRDLHRVAVAVFTHALERLADADDEHADLASLYFDRWVARGRCPADDRLDQWRRDGTLFPPRESPVPYGVDARTVAAGSGR